MSTERLEQISYDMGYIACVIDASKILREHQGIDTSELTLRLQDALRERTEKRNKVTSLPEDHEKCNHV